MKPGIKDVAKVAGVSPTTVSRVLNNRGYISEETRKKVYDAMEEINYYPNEIARALLNNRTYFVGVIGSRITGGGFGGCTVSIVEEGTVDKFIEEIGKTYKEKVGHEAEFYVVDIGDGAKIV